MKIKLIFAAVENDPIKAVVSTPPAGITLLAAYVPDDMDVSLVDMLAGDQIDFNDGTDLVGITVRTPAADVAYRIADQFREKGVTVVLGGPHVSAVPLDAVAHADAVAVGEAESTWPKLLKDFSGGCLKKFYVCGPMEFDPGRNTVYHEPELSSLEHLPLPRQDLLPNQRYRMDSIFTTRGCPYTCSFCPVPNLFGKKPRHRPVDDVVKEVDTLGPYFFNLDDNILGVTGDEEYYLELFDKLSKLGKKRIWSGQAGLGVLSTSKGRDVLRLAVKSGLISVSVGIESVSRSGLSESCAWQKLSLAKNEQNFQKTKEQIQFLQDHGLFVVGWFVIGWDDDDREAYERSLEFAQNTGMAPIIINLAPMPGTRCYDDFIQAKRIKTNTSWDDYRIGGDRIVYTHPRLSEKEMAVFGKAAMKDGYSLKSMLSRSIAISKQRLGLKGFIMSMMAQRGFKKAFG